MIELAMHAGNSGLLQKDISESQNIPLKYLDKIISGLRSAELITNVSGKKSGYILNRKPSKISVYDIYHAFEGKLTIIHCLNEITSCRKNKRCASQEIWSELNEGMKTILSKNTLDQLTITQKKLDSTEKENIEVN